MVKKQYEITTPSQRIILHFDVFPRFHLITINIFRVNTFNKSKKTLRIISKFIGKLFRFINFLGIIHIRIIMQHMIHIA